LLVEHVPRGVASLDEKRLEGVLRPGVLVGELLLPALVGLL
jgi:hypothetical protein